VPEEEEPEERVVARAPYLPPATVLQERANQALSNRSYFFFALLAAYFAIVTYLATIFPGANVRDFSMLLVPWITVLSTAVVMPGTPPTSVRPLLFVACIIAYIACQEVCRLRYREYKDGPFEEMLLRVVCATAFAIHPIIFGVGCLSSGIHQFWPLGRACFAGTNFVRLLIVLRLRLLTAPTTYPPGLPFEPAVLNCIGWLAMAASLEPSLRQHLSATMGASVVIFPLRTVKHAPLATKRARRDELSDEAELERVVRELVASNATTRRKLEQLTKRLAQVETASREGRRRRPSARVDREHA